MVNALSVDLEEWYHPQLLRHHVCESGRVPRLRHLMPRILDLFRRHHTKATFFVLGSIVKGNEDLIRQIETEGHEIASHGFSHKPLYELTPKSFDVELERTEKEIALTGINQRPAGFRAPTFSLNHETAWALEVLARRGYRYDSSVFPLRNHVYGVDGAPSKPYRPCLFDPCRTAEDGKIIEFPLTVYGRAPFALPVCGGFYLRVLPLGLILRLVARLNQSKQPVMIYFHPWEVDQNVPRLPLPILDRWITYQNTGLMLSKIETLLKTFRFAPIGNVLDQWQVCP